MRNRLLIRGAIGIALLVVVAFLVVRVWRGRTPTSSPDRAVSDPAVWRSRRAVRNLAAVLVQGSPPCNR